MKVVPRPLELPPPSKQRIKPVTLIPYTPLEKARVTNVLIKNVRQASQHRGWQIFVALLSALGILEIAYIYTASRFNLPVQDFFVWPGFLLIFVPTTVRLFSAHATRYERIGLLCMLGTALYCAELMFEPLRFTPYDGFLHWRTLTDIIGSHHLFSFNSMLPVSPYYPGLEIVTDALSSVSGLNVFATSLIILALARLIMILGLFLLYEWAIGSVRVAGIATLIYMTNPHFMIFDAQFAYESLALPLCTLMLCSLAYLDRQQSGKYGLLYVPVLLLIAVIITHHMTDFVSDGFLFVWLFVAIWQRRKHGWREIATFVLHSPLALICIFSIVASVIDVTLIGPPVTQYLSSYYASALHELGSIITRTSGARQLFVTYSGQPTPLWERMLTFGSIGLVMLGIPFGLYSLWQRYRFNTLVCMFGVLTLGYPLSQVFRFTNFGTEITDRAAAFLFIPMSAILTLAIVRFWPVRNLKRRHIFVLTSILTLLFLGGIIIGSGPPWERLPANYMVAADERSVEPEGIQAALWTEIYLGPNNRLASDRTNEFLMSTYGDQRIVNTLNDNADIPAVFLSPTFDANVRGIIRQANIHYLAVDKRMSRALPALGFYYETAETSAFKYTTPIKLTTLTKFNQVAQIDCVFDSGNIVIYSTKGVLNASETP